MVIGTVRKKDQKDHGGERGEAQQKFEIIFFYIIIIFSKLYKPLCGKVAKGCKNDPLKMLAQSVKVPQWHFILVKES